MITYKADSKPNLYYIIGFAIILYVFIFLSSGFTLSGLIFILLITIFLAVYNLFSSSLDEIQIDEINKKLILVYKNSFTTLKTAKYDFSTIKFSYKQQATSIRSGVKNVCSIYDKDKRIAQLIPGTDGWDDSEIFNFVHGLVSEGIERKFIGYTLKDAEL